MALNGTVPEFCNSRLKVVPSLLTALTVSCISVVTGAATPPLVAVTRKVSAFVPAAAPAPGPVEAVHAGALGAEVHGLQDGAARCQHFDLHRVGGIGELEAALPLAGGRVDGQLVAGDDHVAADERTRPARPAAAGTGSTGPAPWC